MQRKNSWGSIIGYKSQMIELSILNKNVHSLSKVVLTAEECGLCLGE